MHRLDVEVGLETDAFHGFAIAIVVAGEGRLSWDGGKMAITQSDQLFVPASVGKLLWSSETNTLLTVVLCFPPASKTK